MIKCTINIVSGKDWPTVSPIKLFELILNVIPSNVVIDFTLMRYDDSQSVYLTVQGKHNQGKHATKELI